jgi:hypothetical protein
MTSDRALVLVEREMRLSGLYLLGRVSWTGGPCQILAMVVGRFRGVRLTCETKWNSAPGDGALASKWNAVPFDIVVLHGLGRCFMIWLSRWWSRMCGRPIVTS